MRIRQSCAALALLMSAGHSFAELPKVVVMSGQAVPGFSGASFFGITLGNLNDQDDVTFLASLFPSPSTLNGVFSGQPGSVVSLARVGNTAPGFGASGSFKFMQDSVTRHDNGLLQAAGFVTASPTPPTASDQAIWTGLAGTLQLAAREGTAVVTGGPTLLSWHANYGSNAAGRIAINATLSGPASTNEGIVTGLPGALQIAARKGTAVPDIPTQTFGTFSLPVINASGNVLMHVAYAGGSSPGNGYYLWNAASSTLLQLASTDQNSVATTLPGLPGYRYRGSFDTNARLNDAGHVVFRAVVSEPGPFGGFRDSLVLGRPTATPGLPSAYQILTRTGDAAPDSAAGVVFSSLQPTTHHLELNENGNVAFMGDVSGTGISFGQNSRGLWFGGVGEPLAKIVKLGDVAPGTGGATFRSFTWTYGVQTYTDHFAINDRDSVVFMAQLQGAGITAANDIQLWTWHEGSGLRAVVREGDLVEVTPGVTKTIRDLYGPPSAVQFSDSNWFNDNGKVVFGAAFTDGTTALAVTAVPEPATWASMVAGLLLLGAITRRRAALR